MARESREEKIGTEFSGEFITERIDFLACGREAMQIDDGDRRSPSIGMRPADPLLGARRHIAEATLALLQLRLERQRVGRHRDRRDSGVQSVHGTDKVEDCEQCGGGGETEQQAAYHAVIVLQ